MANMETPNGRFSHKYHQFGMYRDTSIMGATRAKEIEKVRLENEERRAKAAVEKLREKEREERETKAMALKAKLRRMSRQQRQLEMETRHEAAYVIQTAWREYTRFNMECMAMLMEDSAIHIQRAYRGWKGRHKFKFEVVIRKSRCAIHLQRLYRGKIAREERRVLELKNEASAIQLQRVFRGYTARIQFEELQQGVAAVRIQCMVRRFFALEEASTLRIANARAQSEKHEREHMAKEDVASKIIENEERERILMREEDMLMRRLRAETKRKQAEEQGIPLLPWRKRKESFRDLVEEQRRERKISQALEEKRAQEESERKAKEKAEMLAKIEQERQQSLQRALRKKEKERKRLLREQSELKRQAKEERLKYAERLREDKDREKRGELLSKSKQQEEAEAERRRRDFLQENRRRVRELLERNKDEQELLREATKQRMEEFMKKDEQRLEMIRRNASERAKRDEEEAKLLEEERKIKELEAECKRKEKEDKEAREREQFRKRIERNKRLKEKQLQEEKERQEREQEQRKLVLKEKAAQLRKQLVKYPCAPGKGSGQIRRKGSTHRQVGAQVMSARDDSSKKDLTPRTESDKPGRPSHNKHSHRRDSKPRNNGKGQIHNRSVAKLSKNALQKSSDSATGIQSFSEIVKRTEEILLPKIKGIKKPRDDPLTRALEWKRAQLMEMSPEALENENQYLYLKESLGLPTLPKVQPGERNQDDEFGSEAAKVIEEADQDRNGKEEEDIPSSFDVHKFQQNDIPDGDEDELEEQDDVEMEEEEEEEVEVEAEVEYDNNRPQSNLDSTYSEPAEKEEPEEDEDEDDDNEYYDDDYEEDYEDDFEETNRKGSKINLKLPTLSTSMSNIETEDFEEDCAARVIQLAFLRHSLATS